MAANAQTIGRENASRDPQFPGFADAAVEQGGSLRRMLGGSNASKNSLSITTH